jgi:hypothetical protein
MIASIALAVAHVVVDRIAHALAIEDSTWAKFAAAAAAAAAIATAFLAWLTRNLAKATRDMSSATKEMVYKTAESVAVTRAIIANDNANHRATTTIGLLAQYSQATVPITKTIALTAYAAASQLSTFSKDLTTLRALKAQYDATSTEPQHEQYRAIGAAISIVINFYVVAFQLLRRDLLDVPLFMNTFAKTFLSTFEALCTVNTETGTVPPSKIARLDNFEKICDKYLSDSEKADFAEGI